MALISPLYRRDFRLLWMGMSVSLIGDGIFVVAIAWQAYALSNQPSSLAYVGLANALPQIALLLVGGAVSDRSDRRRVLALADIVRAAAVGILALVTAVATPRLWDLIAIAGIIGTATAFASPSLDALVPQLLPPDELTQANALDQAVRPLAVQLAGPALGGLVVAVVRPAGAFAFDALTFLFSALCILRMTPRQLSVDVAQIGSLRHEVHEGLRYVRGQVWLWGTFLSATLAYLLFIGPTQVLLPYIVRNSLHAGASAYGTVLAAGGVGALLGGLLMGRGRNPRRPVTWIYLWWTIATLAVAGFGLATNEWGLVVSAFVINGAEALGAVVWSTLKQRRVPNSMLGRVSSIDWCLSSALLPLSYALTVPVAHFLGVRTKLVVAGTAGASITLGFLFFPGMRADEETVATPVVPQSAQSLSGG
jgi:MFS family permease